MPRTSASFPLLSDGMAAPLQVKPECCADSMSRIARRSRIRTTLSVSAIGQELRQV